MRKHSTCETFIFLVVYFVAFSVAIASPQNTKTAAKPANADSKSIVLENIVRTFYALREKTLDERGTEGDVVKLLDLLTAEATYDHPVFKVRMSKSQAREGILAHLNEGKVAKIILGPIRTGKGFAVVETELSYEVVGKPIVRKGVSIFEFEGGKIVRVAEY